MWSGVDSGQAPFPHVQRGPFPGAEILGTVEPTSPASRRVLVVFTRLLAALACCGLLLLAGCTDDSSSAGPPPSTPTSAPSSPDSSPSQKAETPEEFVRRWVAADTKMQNSGEGGTYRR